MANAEMPPDLFTDSIASPAAAVQKVSNMLKNLLMTIGGLQQDSTINKAIEEDADIKEMALDLYKYTNSTAYLKAETMKHSVHKQAEMIHLLMKTLSKQHVLPAQQQSGPIAATPMANLTRSSHLTPIKLMHKTAQAMKCKAPVNATQRGHEN
jgi:hypothetical protein